LTVVLDSRPTFAKKHRGAAGISTLEFAEE
jgi:hypothetical protein